MMIVNTENSKEPFLVPDADIIEFMRQDIITKSELDENGDGLDDDIFLPGLPIPGL